MSLTPRPDGAWRRLSSALVMVLSAAVALPAAEARLSPGADESVRAVPDGSVEGIPWTSPDPGITETVAEIMARERRQPTFALLDVRPPKREHSVFLKRGSNPDGPAVAQWPAAVEAAEPVAENPQTVGTTFDTIGLSESGFIPPDTQGDVGPTQVLVHLNGRIKVFSKAGVLGSLNVTDAVFWSSVRNGFGVTDPHIRYDRLSQRWYLCIVNVPLDVNGNATGPNRVLIAVSSGPTITSTSSFTFFQFQQDQAPPAGDVNNYSDYPTLGVDRSALYIGVNQFNQTLTDFVNTTAFVVRKSDLLAGTLTVTAFRNLIDFGTGVGILTPQGVHNDDPLAGEGHFVGVDAFFFDEVIVRRVFNPGTTPSLGPNVTLVVPTTFYPVNQAQPGGPPTLDALDDRLFAAQVHTNKLTGVRTLWTAHNIAVTAAGVGSVSGDRNGARWYQIGNLTTTPALVQAGTLFDPNAPPFGYWIPSVAQSGQGHMAMGVSRASTNPSGGHASVAVAGRLRTDGAGVTQVSTLAQGSIFRYDTSYPFDPERWGDYSQTVVDPNDDQTMWTFQEYADALNSWMVRAVQLLAPPPATPVSASPAIINTGVAATTVTITGTSSAGSEFFDPGPDTGGPGFANRIVAVVSGGVTVNSIVFNSPTQVTLNVSTVGAPAGAKNVTVTNPDGQSRAGVGILAVVVPCPSITLNPATIPAGRVGNAYSQTFTQTGATPPATFSLSGGLLAGMSFNAGTATLSGTPSQAGTFPINITVRDINNCQRTRGYALIIASTMGTAPTGLAIDGSGNGVYEPGESVVMDPAWLNNSGGTFSPLTGTATLFTGPGTPSNPAYSVVDNFASYGVLPDGGNTSCGSATGDCYTLAMTTPSSRPLQHWDATCTEVLSNTDSKNWAVHIGLSFADVPTSYPFYRFVETIFHRGVTSGCTSSDYCASSSTLRAQMAVFLLRSKEGTSYTPPPATGMFNDVPTSDFFAAYIEELARRGITTGCQLSPPLYCPGNPVLRSQMAVFLLRAFEGNAYAPPPATGMFDDVPASDFFAPYIEELARRNITTGCNASPPLYCPNDPITRGQMAVFLTRTFSMTLYSQ